jgi:hypothetical protein
MALVRIANVKPLEDFQIELTLTTGEVVQRDIGPLLKGPVFALIRTDPAHFRQLRVEDGALVWPGGVDLCPDTVIWGGLPPADSDSCAA